MNRHQHSALVTGQIEVGKSGGVGLAVQIEERSVQPVGEHVVVIAGDHVTGCLYIDDLAWGMS